VKLEAGQVAVVTGGASGIGFALAHQFAQRGLQVVIADVEEPALELAVDQLGGDDSVLGVPTDVSDLEQVQALADRTLERFGRVDVICNNAGVFAAVAPMWELDRADWVWTLQVNLWGVINGITTFVPLLVERGEGHVLNTSSMAGIATVPFLGPYTATKHAVVGLSESLAAELRRAAPSVGVTVICPGQVDTRIGSAGRNRPADLLRPGQSPAPPADPAAPQQAAGDSLLSPEQVAGDAIAGIEAGRLHVMTAPGGETMVRRRVDQLLGDITTDPT